MSPDDDQVDFVFDSFIEYQGGIEKYASTILKLNVSDNAPFTCQWKLKMIVSNNGWGVPEEWNPLATYGAAGAGQAPTLDMLEVRISNQCDTPVPGVNDTWRSFAIPPGNGDEIIIVDDVGVNPGGGCGGTQVNGAGSYLDAPFGYGEYTFNIDYRIRPGVVSSWRPGYYNMSVKFCLTE